MVVMCNWLARLIRKGPAHKQVLDSEREAQGLRLELVEQEQKTRELSGELDRLRRNAVARAGDAVRGQMERLLTDTATPVSQLLTQAHLLEIEGKPVQAKDVLAVAKRLVRVLEDSGLTLEGRVGEIVSFNPDCHQPLSAATEAVAAVGQPVRVRFVGTSYRGKVLRKVGVEIVGD